MKHLTFTLASVLVLATSAARADGFTCQTNENDMNIKVYDHVTPAQGTRTAAVMVISDPAIGDGLKTTARFTDVNDTLSSNGASYTADVDLRFSDSRKGGRLISGTKLMYLDTIRLDVDYNFSEPVEAGQELSGALTLTKRDGEQIRRDVTCTRYLKGE